MNDFTYLEFNKAMADMEDIAIVLSGYYDSVFYELDVEREDWDNSIKEWNPYNDWNQLILIAIKYNVLSRYDFSQDTTADTIKQFIRNYLWNLTNNG